MERKGLDYEINEIRGEILTLADLVEKATRKAATALRDHNSAGSQAVLDEDRLINQKRYQLEGTIIAVIATQQPTAHDLRLLTAILDMCTELERMGDYAKGIAAINLRSGGLSLPRTLINLNYMADKVMTMLQKAMEAFMKQDVETAIILAREDDLIDALYTQIYYEAMDLAIEDPRNLERVNYVLWAAHNLERSADRVTNICERTVFVATGELKEFHLTDRFTVAHKTY